MYGFRKRKGSEGEMEFSHVYFVKEQPELMKNIQRKTGSSKSVEEDILHRFKVLKAKCDKLERIKEPQEDSDAALISNPVLKRCHKILAKEDSEKLTKKQSMLIELTKKCIKEFSQIDELYNEEGDDTANSSTSNINSISDFETYLGKRETNNRGEFESFFDLSDTKNNSLSKSNQSEKKIKTASSNIIDFDQISYGISDNEDIELEENYSNMKDFLSI